MKKIVFISTPMSGKTDEEIRANIEKAKAKYLELTGEDIRNVSFINNLDMGERALNAEKEDAKNSGAEFIEPKRMNMWYLGIALNQLSYCDEVIFYPETWVHSKGCQIEHEVCSKYQVEHWRASSEGDFVHVTYT